MSRLLLPGRTRHGKAALFPDWVRQATESEIGHRVRFLGGVPEADKPLLYRAATLFVFPSRYEGFGLDPLEAMACGTPVVCSDATSLPEVVGEGGILVPPDDANAWRQPSDVSGSPDRNERTTPYGRLRRPRRSPGSVRPHRPLRSTSR